MEVPATSPRKGGRRAVVCAFDLGFSSGHSEEISRRFPPSRGGTRKAGNGDDGGPRPVLPYARTATALSGFCIERETAVEWGSGRCGCSGPKLR